MPKQLSSDQQSAVDELSKVLNGDPRAKLFAGSAAGASGAAGGDRKEAGDGAS